MKVHHGTFFDRWVGPDNRVWLQLQTPSGSFVKVCVCDEDAKEAIKLWGQAQVHYAYRGGRAFYIPLKKLYPEIKKMEEETEKGYQRIRENLAKLKIFSGRLLDRWVDWEDRTWMRLQTSRGTTVEICVPDRYKEEPLPAQGGTVVDYIYHNGQRFYISPEDAVELEIEAIRAAEQSKSDWEPQWDPGWNPQDQDQDQGEKPGCS